MITLHHGDCLEVMHTIPDGSVDMILADLPYGTTACKWDTVIDLPSLWKHYKRIIKRNGAIVLTASQPFTTTLIASNMEMFKYTWVWVKTKPSNHVNAKLRPMGKHEDVLVFSLGTIANCSPRQMAYYPQGLRRVDRHSFRPSPRFVSVLGARPSHLQTIYQEYENYPDTVLTFPNGNNKKLHPTQKPAALMEYLIRTYTNEGETVLDNTMGSGTTGVACINTNRHFIGIEKDAGYFQIASERIRKAEQTYKQAELITA